MGRSVLIKDTTREERMQIVAKGLDWCGGCSLGVGAIEKMYAPYIDGLLELAEVNLLHAATKFTHG